MIDSAYIGILLLRLRRWLTGAGHALDLAIRLYIAEVFFASGLSKIRDWDSTQILFREEYRVPLLSPDIAALMAAFGELFFPVLLGLGLATRFAALALTFINIIAVISYWHVLRDLDAALAQHWYWGTLLLVTLLHGPGKIALDNFVWPRPLRA